MPGGDELEFFPAEAEARRAREAAAPAMSNEELLSVPGVVEDIQSTTDQISAMSLPEQGGQALMSPEQAPQSPPPQPPAAPPGAPISLPEAPAGTNELVSPEAVQSSEQAYAVQQQQEAIARREAATTLYNSAGQAAERARIDRVLEANANVAWDPRTRTPVVITAKAPRAASGGGVRAPGAQVTVQQERVNTRFGPDDFAALANEQLASVAGSEQARSEGLLDSASIIDQQIEENARAKEFFDQAVSQAREDTQRQMEVLAESVRNLERTRVNPNNFFSSRGAHAALGAALSIAAGTIAQALIPGSSNTALNIINSAIDRDLQAQAQNAQTAQAAVSAQSNLLTQMRAVFSDDRAAFLAARALKLKDAQLRLKAIEARTQGEQAKAQIRGLIAETQMGLMDHMNQVAALQGRTRISTTLGMSPEAAMDLINRQEGRVTRAAEAEQIRAQGRRQASVGDVAGARAHAAAADIHQEAPQQQRVFDDQYGMEVSIVGPYHPDTHILTPGVRVTLPDGSSIVQRRSMPRTDVASQRPLGDDEARLRRNATSGGTIPLFAVTDDGNINRRVRTGALSIEDPNRANSLSDEGRAALGETVSSYLAMSTILRRLLAISQELGTQWTDPVVGEAKVLLARLVSLEGSEQKLGVMQPADVSRMLDMYSNPTTLFVAPGGRARTDESFRTALRLSRQKIQGQLAFSGYRLDTGEDVAVNSSELEMAEGERP